MEIWLTLICFAVVLGIQQFRSFEVLFVPVAKLFGWICATPLRASAFIFVSFLILYAAPSLYHVPTPAIHDEFHMSETQVGILAGLPVVLFAFAAIPGSMLIARFGALATAIIGLVVTGLGSALRGAAPDVWVLYGATIVTGFGVAVMQPSMPPLVRAWLPDRIGFATAVYSNGLIIGEILPVALMIPLVLPLVGGSWRLGFVAWGVPCFAIAAALYALGPRPSATPRPPSVSGASASS